MNAGYSPVPLRKATMLYEAYQVQRDVTGPARATAAFALGIVDKMPAGVRQLGAVRFAAATAELMARSALGHTRPPYGIDRVVSHGTEVEVTEEVVDASPFCTLLHFRKHSKRAEPRVLVVAAWAGHFSTLLRPTIETLLADHDVWVTDWHNARDVPVSDGRFGFDEYVATVVRHLRLLGSGVHVLAVCQPCPATLAAVALLAQGGDRAVPRSLTLMAGPVDTRVNPTAVNELAERHPLSWFEDNVITTVPWRYSGAGRSVYPGFLQVSGFVAMNWQRHLDQHLALLRARSAGDDATADAICAFYDEYCAVLDLPAEFYLETLDRVFQRQLLARGELVVDGTRVDPGAITRTGLMTVEGERDDICGIGQTMAAHDVCPNVPSVRRVHHLQPGAGHYGVFSGSRWQRQIYPRVCEFVLAND